MRGAADTERAARVASRITTVGVGILTLFAGALPLIVFPGRTGDDTDVLPKVVAARAVVLILAFLWAARALVSGRVQLRRTALDLPVLAVVASAALSTVLSVNPVLSVYGTYTRYEGLLTIAVYALLFWLTVQFIDGPDTGRRLLRAMLAGAAVECVLACSQTLAASVDNDLSVFGESATTFGGVARALGTMGNANNLAIWLAMLIPIALYETLTVRAVWARVLAAALTLTMLLTLLLTFGRAAWLGAAVGVSVTVVMISRRIRLRRSAGLALAAVAITVLVVGGASVAASRVGLPVIGPVLNRLASIGDPSNGSGGVRLGLYARRARAAAAPSREAPPPALWWRSRQ